MLDMQRAWTIPGASPVKILTNSAALLATVIALAAMVGSVAVPHSVISGDHEAIKARVAAPPAIIVAVISPMPDEVSNGTRSILNASGSTDSAGTITNYTWDITYKGAVTTTYAMVVPYKFKDLGLYRITLTVTDDHDRTSQAFEAVYSILDSDGDSLPDWWEIKYFKDLKQTGSGDYDHDGYTNLEEYAAGQDPTVKNPSKGIRGVIEQNWMYLVAIAAAVVVALVILFPRMKKKRNAIVKKKIEAAIEIEKALEVDK